MRLTELIAERLGPSKPSRVSSTMWIGSKTAANSASVSCLTSCAKISESGVSETSAPGLRSRIRTRNLHKLRELGRPSADAWRRASQAEGG
jgi:hypothetical protein